VPVSVNVRVQLPSLRPSPYLVVGGGTSWFEAVLDPPDFNATLRAGHWVPFLQAGAGIQVELSARTYLGVEARYLHLSDFHAFDSTLRLSGLSASAVLGVRR
jgi:opacity protein-like surface antigen